MEDLARGNALLESVDPDLLDQLSPRPRMVAITRNEVLIGQASELDYVYFPVSGLVGILAETADGESVDSALVGREGGIGIFEACGSRHYSAEALVHVPGRAVRMAAAAYRQLFDLSPGLRTAVHLYVEQCLNETRQSLLCTTSHDIEARLCRLVLEAVDRARLGDTLPLTQRTMASILGAQRSTISESLAKLEREGFVVRSRGAIRVEDRAALERCACSCRLAVRAGNDAIWQSDEPACEAIIAAE